MMVSRRTPTCAANCSWVKSFNTGTRDAHRHSRGYRRVVFFLLGVLLIVVSIWGFVLKLK